MQNLHCGSLGGGVNVGKYKFNGNFHSRGGGSFIVSFALYHKNDDKNYQILPDLQMKISKLCSYFHVNVWRGRGEGGSKYGMEISIHFVCFLQ